MNKAINAFGWVGAILLLSAFAASSYGYLQQSDAVYQLMNLVGATGIAAQAYKRRAYPATALNVVWALVALIALFRLI